MGHLYLGRGWFPKILNYHVRINTYTNAVSILIFIEFIKITHMFILLNYYMTHPAYNILKWTIILYAFTALTWWCRWQVLNSYAKTLKLMLILRIYFCMNTSNLNFYFALDSCRWSLTELIFTCFIWKNFLKKFSNYHKID